MDDEQCKWDIWLQISTNYRFTGFATDWKRKNVPTKKMHPLIQVGAQRPYPFSSSTGHWLHLFISWSLLRSNRLQCVAECALHCAVDLCARGSQSACESYLCGIVSSFGLCGGLGMSSGCPRTPLHGQCYWAIGNAACPTSSPNMYRAETQWASECGLFSES